MVYESRSSPENVQMFKFKTARTCFCVCVFPPYVCVNLGYVSYFHMIN